jgi:hypothetical protein
MAVAHACAAIGRAHGEGIWREKSGARFERHKRIRCSACAPGPRGNESQRADCGDAHATGQALSVMSAMPLPVPSRLRRGPQYRARVGRRGHAQSCARAGTTSRDGVAERLTDYLHGGVTQAARSETPIGPHLAVKHDSTSCCRGAHRRAAPTHRLTDRDAALPISCTQPQRWTLLSRRPCPSDETGKRAEKSPRPAWVAASRGLPS